MSFLHRASCLAAVFVAVAAAALAIASSACEPDDACDPNAAVEDGCLVSRFAAEDKLGREVSGRARLGVELVSDATVKMIPTPGYPSSDGFAPDGGLATVITDEHGLYRFSEAPFFYDLAIDRGADFFWFRRFPVRYTEPSLGNDGPPRVFSAHLRVALTPPLAPDQAVMFFVTGTDAYDASGDDPSDVTVRMRQFSQTLTLFAVTYPKGDTILHATSAGSAAGALVEADQRLETSIQLFDVLPKPFDFTITGTPPAGMTAPSVTFALDCGTRQSSAPLTTAALGAEVALPIIAGARYSARAVATDASGAISDTGRFFIDPTKPTVTLTFPDPPQILSSGADGGSETEGLVDGGVPLVASAKGPREHLFVPVAGDATRPTLHVITDEDTPVFPDFVSLGLSPPSGTYVWTVRNWPQSTHAWDIGGVDIRETFQMGVSAPRTVTLP